MTKWIAVLPVCAWLHRIMVKTIPYLRSLAHLTREGVSVAGIRDSLTAIGMNSATFEMSFKQWFSAEELCRHWANGGKGIVVVVEPNEDFYQKTAIKERHSLRDFARKYILPYKAQLIQALELLALQYEEPLNQYLLLIERLNIISIKVRLANCEEIPWQQRQY